MCLICIHFNDNKLTVKEAFRNLDEMGESIGPEHTRDVMAMLVEAEIDNLMDDLFCEEDFDIDDKISIDWPDFII